jgi:hypothetical protein
LSFQDRGLNYTYLAEGNKVETFLKRTESVWLQFPVMLKLRTNRAGNFAAYGLIGGCYGIDMQSQKDVNEAVAGKIVVKLEKTDITIDAGGGFDFFLPYFKFKKAINSPIRFQNCARAHSFFPCASRARCSLFAVHNDSLVYTSRSR